MYVATSEIAGLFGEPRSTSCCRAASISSPSDLHLKLSEQKPLSFNRNRAGTTAIRAARTRYFTTITYQAVKRSTSRRTALKRPCLIYRRQDQQLRNGHANCQNRRNNSTRFMLRVGTRLYLHARKAHLLLHDAWLQRGGGGRHLFYPVHSWTRRRTSDGCGFGSLHRPDEEKNQVGLVISDFCSCVWDGPRKHWTYLRLRWRNKLFPSLITRPITRP